jgi:hypothetical protein
MLFPTAAQKVAMRDAGRRRHLSWGVDFDTRVHFLDTTIEDGWDDQVKSQHLENRKKIEQSLTQEFGVLSWEMKRKNFIDIQSKPFSTIAHHNAFFDQTRRSFVIGSYYPALVGACALGERILNHLILDLRDYFRSTPEYKQVHRKNSFDDWQTQIEILSSWEVLLTDVAAEFRSLKDIRHRSIHFNPDTYKTLRADALSAILHLRTIIERQFGGFGTQPWYIPNTRGHVFIRKDFETKPFVQTYLLPKCPFVGTLFAMSHSDGEGWSVYDLPDYGAGDWTDDEFAQAFNERDISKLATPSNKMSM